MDKIKFASLIGFLSLMAKTTFTQATIIEINNLIDDGIDKQPSYQPATMTEINNAAGRQVIEMLSAMATQGKKIDAIKACRNLTGLGLKEAKDLVENAMTTPKF